MPYTDEKKGRRNQPRVWERTDSAGQALRGMQLWPPCACRHQTHQAMAELMNAQSLLLPSERKSVVLKEVGCKGRAPKTPRPKSRQTSTRLRRENPCFCIKSAQHVYASAQAQDELSMRLRKKIWSQTRWADRQWSQHGRLRVFGKCPILRSSTGDSGMAKAEAVQHGSNCPIMQVQAVTGEISAAPLCGITDTTQPPLAARIHVGSRYPSCCPLTASPIPTHPFQQPLVSERERERERERESARERERERPKHSDMQTRTRTPTPAIDGICIIGAYIVAEFCRQKQPLHAPRTGSSFGHKEGYTKARQTQSTKCSC